MKPASSTIKAAGSWGFIASIALGLIAIIWPDIYARVPPGFEGALVIGIATIAGKLQKENVYTMVLKK